MVAVPAVDLRGWGGAAAGPVQPEWDFEAFAFTAIYLLCGKRLPWIPDAPFTGALQVPSSSETFGLKRVGLQPGKWPVTVTGPVRPVQPAHPLAGSWPVQGPVRGPVPGITSYQVVHYFRE